MELEKIKNSISQQPFFETENGLLYCADCLDIMKQMPDKCVDLVVTDPPYGLTRYEWDIKINFKHFFDEVNIKSKHSIVFSQQPTTTDIIVANRNLFRYELIWEKVRSSNYLDCNKRPLKSHENILIFGQTNPPYKPQFWYSNPTKRLRHTGEIGGKHTRTHFKSNYISGDGKRFPRSVLKFQNIELQPLHPSAKPLDLIEYLLLSFSEKNDIVLDPFLGSGSTCVVAERLNRKWIGIEISEEYCKIAQKRIEGELEKKKQEELFK